MSKGTPGVYRRCGCSEIVTGPDGEPERDKRGRVKRRQYGPSCPELKASSKHGSWTFSAALTGRDGKRQQIVRSGFTSKKQAQQERTKLLSKSDQGYRIDDRVTVGDYLAEWLDGRRDLGRGTLNNYRSHMRLYLVPHLGHLRLMQLRRGHVDHMLNQVNGGAATQQRVLAPLRSALKAAVAEGLIAFNPAGQVQLGKGEPTKTELWTDQRVEHWRDTGEKPFKVMAWHPETQVPEFYVHVEGDRFYALWLIAVCRGLRRGELCGLRWQDVDLDAGEVQVRNQRVRAGSDLYESPPKSRAGNRPVPLDDDMVSALRAWRNQQRQERLAWGEAWTNTGHVFTREDGAPLEPQRLSDAFKRIIRDSGLPPIRFHDLRHTAATVMLADGWSMDVVRDVLGHQEIGMTMDTYAAVTQESVGRHVRAGQEMRRARIEKIKNREVDISSTHTASDTNVASISAGQSKGA